MSNALKLIKSQLEELSESGMLRGTLSVEAQFALIKGSNSMEEALAGASFVQVIRNYHNLKEIYHVVKSAFIWRSLIIEI